MESILEKDRKFIWHPFTSFYASQQPIAIVKGEGIFLIDEKHNHYLDAISSWWVTLHGHAHPYIAEKIYKQALEIEQVIFAGFTHKPAVELAERLLQILPGSLLEGQPIGIFYGTFFALDANGQQVKSAAGLPQIEKGTQTSPIEYTTARDAAGIPIGTTLRKVIGDPNPDYTASLVNELNYKRFDLRMQLDAVQGNEVFNADFRTRQGVGSGKIAEQEQRGQLPRGWVNSVYQIEQWRISDGSFVKLRELSLGYNLGKLGGFSNLNFRLAGRNLFSWDNYNGYDPEMNAAGQSTILRGIDFGTVPIPRSFNFTVSAKF